MDVIPIAGQLPDPFCHQTWQLTYEQMMAATRVRIPDSIGFTVGTAKPGPNDRDKLWYNQTEHRWYEPDTTVGKWISRNPAPASGGIQLWDRSPTELLTYDGGTVLQTGENPTATKGPMWEIVAEMAGWTPVGVGKVGGLTDGTDLALNATIGEEKGPIIADHQHGFGVLNSEKNSDAVWPSSADFSDAGALRLTTGGVTLPDDQKYTGVVYDAAYKDAQGVGATNLKKCSFVTTKQLAPDTGQPTQASKMQPSKAIYFIRRTARIFYAIDF